MSTPKKKPKENKSDITEVLPLIDTELVANPNLDTVFADIIQTLSRSDGLTVLRFFTKIPGLNHECARVALRTGAVQGMIDSICEATGYIPKTLRQ